MQKGTLVFLLPPGIEILLSAFGQQIGCRPGMQYMLAAKTAESILEQPVFWKYSGRHAPRSS